MRHRIVFVVAAALACAPWVLGMPDDAPSRFMRSV